MHVRFTACCGTPLPALNRYPAFTPSQVDVEAKGDCERRALHHAARSGHVEVVRLLFEHKAGQKLKGAVYG